MKYIDEAVNPNMSDSMIQFDQGYNKVDNNIEAAKKKMANKKYKSLQQKISRTKYKYKK